MHSPAMSAAQEIHESSPLGGLVIGLLLASTPAFAAKTNDEADAAGGCSIAGPSTSGVAIFAIVLETRERRRR